MKFKIEGMMCSHCASTVEKAILTVRGVKSATVDLKRGIAEVEGEPLPTDVMGAVAALGYQITLC